MRQSFGNTLLLAPYQLGQGLKQEIKGGFAFTVQKRALVSLEVKVTAELSNGTIIRKGTKAYLKEDLLSTQAWAKDIREIGESKEQVILVDSANIVFFEDASGDTAN